MALFECNVSGLYAIRDPLALYNVLYRFYYSINFLFCLVIYRGNPCCCKPDNCHQNYDNDNNHSYKALLIVRVFGHYCNGSPSALFTQAF